MKYIIIDENKVPQHSLDQWYTLDEVKDYPNLAILIEEPVVVLDVDDENEGLLLFNIIQDLNIKSSIMKTDRGFHFWFKTREPLINSIKINTPITITVDVKSWGDKKSLVTIKKDGVWRKWLNQHNDLDILPFWLTPFKSTKKLVGLDEGEGRNDGLFTYIIPLLKLKFSKEQIRTTFDIINSHIFKKPLLQRELDVMFKDNDIFNETLAFFNKKEFLHHEFAFWMKQNYPIEFSKGQLYLYADGVYSPNIGNIEMLMIKKIPQLKAHQRLEVLKYLELINKNKVKKPNALWVNTLSGIYDLENNIMLPHSVNIFTINQIPVIFNKGHIDTTVDKFLNGISNGNKDTRLLLEEMIGYCLLNDCRFQKAFILVGAGANGKSVFLKMLTEFLSADSISSIPLEDLNGKFETAELSDKLANIADDVSSEFMSDSSTFKKLVTGDKITAQRKFQNPFQFNNTAKLLFSTNSLPPVSDKSYGLHRRLVIVPFTRTFNKEDGDYDPNILNELVTESAKSYLFNLAIEGINRLLANNQFTIPKEVDVMLNEFIADNNNCVQWLATDPVIDEVEVGNAYRSYTIFSLSNGTKPYKKSRFMNELVSANPNLRIKNTTIQGRFAQVFSLSNKK